MVEFHEPSLRAKSDRGVERTESSLRAAKEFALAALCVVGFFAAAYCGHLDSPPRPLLVAVSLATLLLSAFAILAGLLVLALARLGLVDERFKRYTKNALLFGVPGCFSVFVGLAVDVVPFF